MPTFSYKAKNFEGKEIVGEIEVGDLRELATKLRADGYILIDARNTQQAVKETGLKHLFAKGVNFSIFKRVPLVEKMIFTRNLAVMIGAGLPIARALNALGKETHNTYFHTVIESVMNEVKKGKTLKESFNAHPKVFSSLYVAMVEAGESSGKLEESLNVLVGQMRTDHELVKRVRSAMIYPAIVLVVMILIGIAMLIYVVPTLLETFEELGVELPSTTQFIVTTSHFLLSYWFPLLIAFPFVAAFIVWAFRTAQGKRAVDFVVVRLPVIGSINHEFNTARTARTLGSLLSSGVQIMSALEITSRVVQNHYYTDILSEAREQIQKGETMSSVFSKYPRLYSSLLNEMVSVGEETGKITDMLNEVATFYEEEVNAATKDLSSVVEPVLMVIIGIVVGFFAVSMITPLYSVMSGI